MKRLALSVAVGALACFAAVGSSQAAPVSGTMTKAAPTAQLSTIVDQVGWRRHRRHHCWWRLGRRHCRRGW